jgi:hypothetical protein
VNPVSVFDIAHFHLSQVSHWGSKLAICRALAALSADAAFAQCLFLSTGLATVINVIRAVSTTSCQNAYPSAARFAAPASPVRAAKQTPSLTGAGHVAGEVGARHVICCFAELLVHEFRCRCLTVPALKNAAIFCCQLHRGCRVVFDWALLN